MPADLSPAGRSLTGTRALSDLMEPVRRAPAGATPPDGALVAVELEDGDGLTLYTSGPGTGDRLAAVPSHPPHPFCHRPRGQLPARPVRGASAIRSSTPAGRRATFPKPCRSRISPLWVRPCSEHLPLVAALTI